MLIRFSVKNEIIQILWHSMISCFHNCMDISIEGVRNLIWWHNLESHHKTFSENYLESKNDLETFY